MKKTSSYKPNITVCVLFSSGAMKISDVMEAGGSKEKNQLHDLRHQLQFDDPINIQFTSVCSQAYQCTHTMMSIIHKI